MVGWSTISNGGISACSDHYNNNTTREHGLPGRPLCARIFLVVVESPRVTTPPPPPPTIRAASVPVSVLFYLCAICVLVTNRSQSVSRPGEHVT